MNDANANSPTLDDVAKGTGKSWLAEPKPRGEGWPWRKVFFLIVLAFVVHVALIFFFGTKTKTIPRAIANVPQLQLARSDDELIALENPALFALPNPKDFSSAIWLKIPTIKPPSFGWTEPPQWLPLNSENLGATFRQFMQTNQLAGIELDLKPVPELAVPENPIESASPQNPTLKIIGPLRQRGLQQPVTLPLQAYNNVIAPSKIQVLVDAAGNVISAVLLPDNNNPDLTEHFFQADQDALDIARNLRFARAANLTFGEIIFNWRTIPAASTNASANP
jgi:hypothetical protein